MFAIEQRGKRWQADIGDSLRYRGKPDLIGRWLLPSKGVGHIIIMAAAIAKEHQSHEAASDEAPCHPPPRLRLGDKNRTKSLILLVGAAGFEPTTCSTQN